MLYLLLILGTMLNRLGEEDGLEMGGGTRGRGQSVDPNLESGSLHAVVLPGGRGLCGAYVGNKGKVCIKPRSACNIASHEPRIMEEGLFMRSGEFKVWDDGVPLQGIPQSVSDAVSDMMTRNLPSEEWLVIRDAIREIHSAQGSAETTAMLMNFENVISNLMVHHPLPSEVNEDNFAEVQSLQAKAGTTPMKARRFKPVPGGDVDRFSGLAVEERVAKLQEELEANADECDGMLSDTLMAIKKVASVQG